ncbi:GNAT family protein [Henriciella sp.]|uniref:GNAT family N-acetyltransferase n=1 Tax=Henriciella sp. TaxID=1968823 RepID=UPI0026107BDB|nr:GNAT family protein [Henriciella sp.]
MYDLVPLHAADPREVARFLANNRERFRPYSPTRSDHYFTREHWRAACRLARTEWRDDKAYRFCIELKREAVIGKIDLDRVARGPFQAATLGYMLDRLHEGRSVMRRALADVLRLAFEEFDLHRVEAAIMPDNTRSRALAERLGFREIGLSRAYLKLDGHWRDHVLYEISAGDLTHPSGLRMRR